MQLDILDQVRQDLVTKALEKGDDPALLDTAIREVEVFSLETKAQEIDKAVAFAEILTELEKAKWRLENLSARTPPS